MAKFDKTLNIPNFDITKSGLSYFYQKGLQTSHQEDENSAFYIFGLFFKLNQFNPDVFGKNPPSLEDFDNNVDGIKDFYLKIVKANNLYVSNQSSSYLLDFFNALDSMAKNKIASIVPGESIGKTIENYSNRVISDFAILKRNAYDVNKIKK